jgi:hypothetical protein
MTALGVKRTFLAPRSYDPFGLGRGIFRVAVAAMGALTTMTARFYFLPALAASNGWRRKCISTIGIYGQGGLTDDRSDRLSYGLPI